MADWDGPDVSEYQGQPNWNAFADAYPDVKMIGIKATQGQTYVDRSFYYNIQAVRARIDAGWNSKRTLPNPPVIVFYHFLDQWDAETQANHLRAAIGNIRPFETIACDSEPVPGSIPELSADHVIDFMDRAGSKFNRVCMSYIGYYYKDATDPRYAKYPLWLPNYNGQNETTLTRRPYVVHQYGGAKNVGITPGVDVDANHVSNYQALLANANPAGVVINNQPAAPVAQETKGVVDMGAVYCFPGQADLWMLCSGYVGDAMLDDANGTPQPVTVNKNVDHYFQHISSPDVIAQLVADGRLEAGKVRQLAAGDNALDAFWASSYKVGS